MNRINLKSTSVERSSMLNEGVPLVSSNRKIKTLRDGLDAIVKMASCPMNLLHLVSQNRICSEESVEIKFKISDGFYVGWITVHENEYSVMETLNEKKSTIQSSIKSPFRYKIQDE